MTIQFPVEVKLRTNIQIFLKRPYYIHFARKLAKLKIITNPVFKSYLQQTEDTKVAG